MNKFPTSYDPYDLWSTKKLGTLKVAFYQGSFAAKLGLVPVVLLDTFFPLLIRKLFKVKPHDFSHMTAMLYLAGSCDVKDVELLDYFEARKKQCSTGWGWGLPFEWYSKNGIYQPGTPYITNTPYVMECLVHLMKSKEEDISQRAKICFSGTWGMLESLKVMYQDEGQLALSYGPVNEPYIVINANSYSALSYALHAVYGEVANREVALFKSKNITKWILEQQNKNGSWYYCYKGEAGGMIDSFHSCFVLKNLLKISKMVNLNLSVQEALIKGKKFIDECLFDDDAGLCKRFYSRDISDLFKWDLYDQAEYLGLLVDFDQLDEAVVFSERVEKRFKKGDDWYCRIDIFGRRWGKNFLRWGIAPFWYHQARLSNALRDR